MKVHNMHQSLYRVLYMGQLNLICHMHIVGGTKLLYPSS